MVSLVDIAPATERVTVRGQEIEVSGVSAAGVAQLLARFVYHAIWEALLKPHEYPPERQNLGEGRPPSQ